MTHLELSQHGSTGVGQEYQSHYSQAGHSHLEPRYARRNAGIEHYYGPANNSCGGGQNVGNTERTISVIAGLGLALSGLRRGRALGLLLAATGAGLVWRGISGKCQCYTALGISTAEHNPATAVPASQGFKLERSITIDQSPEKLFQFWRHLDNLPQVIRHLKYVEAIDDDHSHWKAEGAFGADVEWDAEIINERENELIAWRSLPGGDVDTAGSVHFKPLGGSKGTQVTLSMKYNPPAGKVGAQIASLFGEGLEEKLDEDLNRFKEVMETGLPAAPSIAETAYTSRNSPLRDQFT